ncbi:MAG TPA: peptidase C1, partial [Clostridia bacterium]
MNRMNFKLRKFAKKSITNLAALSVVVSGMLIPAQSSFAVTLHPTGLTSLTATSGYAAAPTYNTSNLPTSLDLTSMFPPVGDQASQGSCVAFAVGYAAQSYQVGHDQNYTPTASSQIFSPQYIYSQI